MINFNNDPIRPRDIRKVLRKTSRKSTPGPDGIPYNLLKHLPCIHHLLATIFTRLTETSQVPPCWQQASIILIHKKGDTEDPANYRPIALTSTIGKVFHSILAHRLQNFCLEKNIINRKLQKGFLNHISGCTEHSTVLQNAIRHARRSKHALHCIWLDLKNAFGSVRHDYLNFVLEHYGIPNWLRTYLSSFYSNIKASIETSYFTTAAISLKCGVFQGDTLSPMLFLLAINPLLKYLETQERHGYALRNKRIVTLAYADDLSLISCNQIVAQRILNEVNKRFIAIGLHLKPSKCKSLSIVKGTCKNVNFSINNEKIDNIKDDKFKFLGSTIYSAHQSIQISKLIEQDLINQMKTINELPLRGSYKTELYPIYIIPKLRFQLSVHTLTQTALDNMDKLVRKFIRTWLKIPQSTTFGPLLHRQGLNLKLPSYLYDHGHLITESNPSDDVVEAAIQVQHEQATGMRNTYQQFITSKNKKENTKAFTDSHNQQLLAKASDLHVVLQGQWRKLFNLQCQDTSFQALISGLSESTYCFLIKAVTNTAPTMSYLRTINATTSASCPRCSHSPETLHHALNNCKKALENGLYTWRHNQVLQQINTSLKVNFPTPWIVRSDLEGEEAGHTIPEDILATPLRPDTTIINRVARTIHIVELTICWDTSHANARDRKLQRYAQLRAELEERQWNVIVTTVEIGSRGFTSNETAASLKQLCPSKKHRSNLITKLNQTALSASYCIFIHRNDANWSPSNI